MEPAALITLGVAGSAILPMVVGAVVRISAIVAEVARAASTRIRLPLVVLLVGIGVGRAPAGAATPLPQVRAAPSTAAEPPAPPISPVEPGKFYVVQPGDSLWAIATRGLREVGDESTDVAVDRYWRRIYAANRDVVGPDPDLIFPGQTLLLPGEMP